MRATCTLPWDGLDWAVAWYLPTVAELLADGELVAVTLAANRAAVALHEFRRSHDAARRAHHAAALALAYEARQGGRAQLASTSESMAEKWSGTAGELLEAAEQVTDGHE